MKNGKVIHIIIPIHFKHHGGDNSKVHRDEEMGLILDHSPTTQEMMEDPRMDRTLFPNHFPTWEKLTCYILWAVHLMATVYTEFKHKYYHRNMGW